METQFLAESLWNALLTGNMEVIRAFGKQGMEAWRQKQERRIQRMTEEAEARDKEAHLDICPVD